MTYYSQCNQDRYVNDTFFKNRRDLFFIDIGAFDGVTGSNSYFFENELNWKGICFEPLPDTFQQLKKVRKCECIEGAVSNSSAANLEFFQMQGVEMLSGTAASYEQVHMNRATKEGAQKKTIVVKNYKLKDVLEARGIRQVDFLSIDVEGGELEVLKSIDFDRVHFHVLTIENNYKTAHVRDYLRKHGFELVKNLDADEVFVNTKPDWTSFWNRSLESINTITPMVYGPDYNHCYESLTAAEETRLYMFILGTVSTSLVDASPIVSSYVYDRRYQLLQHYPQASGNVDAVRYDDLNSHKNSAIHLTYSTSSVNNFDFPSTNVVVDLSHTTVDPSKSDASISIDQKSKPNVKNYLEDMLTRHKHPKILIVRFMVKNQIETSNVPWSLIDSALCGAQQPYRVYRVYNDATVYVLP